MVLEIINSCVTNTLHHNPNLVYTLLHRRELFAQFRTHPTFHDIIQNIDTVSWLFSQKWFEPRGICYLFGMIIRVRVVFRKTVVGD